MATTGKVTEITTGRAIHGGLDRCGLHVKQGRTVKTLSKLKMFEFVFTVFVLASRCQVNMASLAFKGL